MVHAPTAAEKLDWYRSELGAALAEVERLTAELAALRTALVNWDFTGPEIGTSNRDKLVDHLAAHYHPDRPYPTVDHIIEVLAEQQEKMDSILYAVIPEDHWGLRTERRR